MKRACAENRLLACRPACAARIVVLSLLIHLLPLRRTQAEDRADIKGFCYQEEHGRIQVLGSAFTSETDLTSTLNLKLGGLYNAISGASPTGAPPYPSKIQVPVTTYVSVPTTVSGASPHSSTTTSVLTPVTTLVSVTNPLRGQLPVGQVRDERNAWSGELDKRFGDNILGVMFYYSTEYHYRSLSSALNYTREFNKKNTLLNLGYSHEQDRVDVYSQGNTQRKLANDCFLGVTQILDPKTVLNASFTLGFSEGYLGDPYKYAQVNGNLLPEQRPDNKSRQIGTVSLTRYVPSLNGSAEGEYRFYRDSFGILAHTITLRWNQKVGRSIILTPFTRFYTQGAADFYAVSFTGSPEYYSADYRLSEMRSFGYGLRCSYTPWDWLSMDASYERYETWGYDGVTSAAAYPKANIVTAGFRLRF